MEPPVAATAAIAFSSEPLVMIELGFRSSSSSLMTSFPASTQTSSLRGSMAGTEALSIGEMPITSNAVAIVLAVNWPPHAPGPGQAACSSADSSASSILPAACAPTASITSWIVTSCPSNRPGAIEPP